MKACPISHPAAIAIAIPLGLGGCVVQTIDLRGAGDVPASCAEGERLDPSTDACAPCLASAPAVTCPCATITEEAAFPYCAGVLLASCAPCSGDLRSCAALDVASFTTTSCDLLLECCRELASDGASVPCCRPTAEPNCAATAKPGEYAFTCVGSSCCTGAACSEDADCGVGQTCDLAQGHCTPACARTEYCCSDCGCECRPNSNVPQ